MVVVVVVVVGSVVTVVVVSGGVPVVPVSELPSVAVLSLQAVRTSAARTEVASSGRDEEVKADAKS